MFCVFCRASATQVICNGEEVISMGGTMETYNVDVWSGNHPFYQVRKRS
jgi:ribosomal protein L31